MNKKINLVIDFDDVILNTGKLWKEVVANLSKYGITEELYFKTKITESRNRENPAFPYFLDNHLRILGIMLDKAEEVPKIKEDIFLFLKKKSFQYIFKDASPFFKNIKNANLLMLTYGEQELQSAKVYGSGIDKYFNQIIITQNPKWMSFEGILKNGLKTIFIDDKISELLNVKTRFNDVITVRMRRDGGRYSNEQSDFKFDYEISDFNDVDKIIKGK